MLTLHIFNFYYCGGCCCCCCWLERQQHIFLTIYLTLRRAIRKLLRLLPWSPAGCEPLLKIIDVKLCSSVKIGAVDRETSNNRDRNRLQANNWPCPYSLNPLHLKTKIFIFRLVITPVRQCNANCYYYFVHYRAHSSLNVIRDSPDCSQAPYVLCCLIKVHQELTRKKKEKPLRSRVSQAWYLLYNFWDTHGQTDW